MVTQKLLDLQDQQITDRCRLQDSRRSSAIAELPELKGKRLEAYTIIARLGPRGATMREVASLAGRGINCWTQPFMDLRKMGLIRTTDERRVGGVVHVTTVTSR